MGDRVCKISVTLLLLFIAKVLIFKILIILNLTSNSKVLDIARRQVGSPRLLHISNLTLRDLFRNKNFKN